MNIRTLSGLLTLGLLLSTYPVRAADAAVKAALAATNEAFSTTRYVAKLDLRRYAHHYVLPDGSPSTKKGKKKQGRGGEGAIQFDDGVKVGSGSHGESIRVYAKKNQLWVGFNKKRGKTLNPALVHILYGRPVTADDITPEKIARAVSSVAEIRGYEPDRVVDAAFDQALSRDEAPEPEIAPGPAQVLAVRLTAEPPSVYPGGEVSIELSYDLRTPGPAIEAVETVNLTFDGASVPGYPRTERVNRSPGSFTVTYRQALPGSARAGVYTLKGEVCVADACIGRTARFEVVVP